MKTVIALSLLLKLACPLCGTVLERRPDYEYIHHPIDNRCFFSDQSGTIHDWTYVLLTLQHAKLSELDESLESLESAVRYAP